MAAEHRIAGTPAQVRSADWVLAEMAAAGLDTSRSVFAAYLPLPDSIVVERTEPRLVNLPLRLALEEPPLPEDSSTRGPTWRAMNGYSGVGDVRGDVLYVNYGLAADYRALDSMGVSAAGRIVLARYGRGYRGIKAREADRHGAAALLLYSDPADDGYMRGDTYPTGPMRHHDAVERGSVSGTEGDPSTPGHPSVAGAARTGRAAMALPRIPVVPISYKNALAFLGSLTQGEIPQAWQGGLPLRYHLGAGEVKARVGVWGDTSVARLVPVHNTFGMLRGTDFPDEVVILGAHRDAWGAGAADNASGVAAVLEAARAWGEAARRGVRPRRTLVFATWDAEEWGLVGSTEWVEQQAARLRATAVAYVNLDMIATGPTLGFGATPSLAPFAAELAPAAGAVAGRVGDLGSGSDFSPFQNGLGVPSVGFGYGGPHGGYHSHYDSPVFVERFGDPGFRRHATVAGLAAVALARLGNADVAPADPVAAAVAARDGLATLRARARSATDSAAIGRVTAAASRFEQEASRFAQARDRRLASGVPARAAEVNAALRRLDRAFVRGAEGAPSRNVLVGAERETRYGSTRLPGLAEALADRDDAAVSAAADALVAAFDDARAAVQDARSAL
jgi:N-acetylated-alpha-linked acidic dipeptidase